MALAGCSGGGGGEGDDGNDDGDDGGTRTPDGGGTDGGDGGGTTSGDGAGTATATPGGETTAGPGSGPDPNCARLTGSPATYDAAGTPFVFTFDYVDSWTLADPLEGPGGRSQGITSPVVTVDGEPESSGIRIGQRFEGVTAAAVDDWIADATAGASNPASVLYEQEYDGETVRVVGIAAEESVPIYRLWLPHGPAGDRRYYRVEIDVLTSILRVGDDGTDLLCLEETLAATETVRESLRPNPDTTIGEV